MLSRFTVPNSISRLFVAPLTAALLALSAAPAAATVYIIELGGWDTGGLLTGEFAGADLTGDGFIVFFDGEVTSFSASFSGSSKVGSFSFGSTDLQGLVYRLDGGQLGNDEMPKSEGVYASSTNFTLLSGIGAAGSPGAFVFDLVADTSAATDSLISVSAVPEPQSVLLMVGGLALLGAAFRYRSASALRQLGTAANEQSLLPTEVAPQI